MLGGFIALLAAASFGFNNAAIRRGVLSGSVLQAMAITVPMGVPFILIITIITGQIWNLGGFPLESYFWLALAGVLHFVWRKLIGALETIQPHFGHFFSDYFA